MNFRGNFSRLFRLILFVLAATGMPLQVCAQMLLTEGLTNVIDTSKRLQGSIAPELGFRTEKKGGLHA